MKYVLTIVMVMLVGGIVYALKDYVVPTTWRYKITVEIETPEGIKSGSAVREVRARKNIARFLNPDVNDVTYEVIGEAVVVDLGLGKSLFALVGSNDEVQRAFFGGASQIDEIAKIKGLEVGKKAELVDINTFVMFEDISDPETIKSLEPSDFVTAFNNRVKFNGVLIEITNDRVTFGTVRETLKWFDRKSIGLTFFDPQIKDPARYLTKSSFIQGEQ